MPEDIYGKLWSRRFHSPLSSHTSVRCFFSSTRKLTNSMIMFANEIRLKWQQSKIALCLLNAVFSFVQLKLNAPHCLASTFTSARICHWLYYLHKPIIIILKAFYHQSARRMISNSMAHTLTSQSHFCTVYPFAPRSSLYPFCAHSDTHFLASAHRADIKIVNFASSTGVVVPGFHSHTFETAANKYDVSSSVNI